MKEEWICVLEDGSQLEAGQILEWNREINGKIYDLVIWRSQSGQACVMDSRCPHQWSHLGSQGAVVGEQIVCGTHFWCFDLDGTGWKENERKGRMDRKADIETYICEERDGGIFIKV